MTTRPLNPDAALPVGIEIGGHAIEAVVAVGETGFVYVASDPLLARQVAIKEYFPPSLAVRHAGTQMRARSASEHQRVMQGRDAFIEESRLLARLDHPALVRVIGAHEAHQTAYRVMPFHAGPTLAHARLERGVPPGDAWVQRMLEDLLGALEVLHDAGIVHGHIHPAQVLLRPDDRPLLLGFGSAARVLQRGVDADWLPPEMAAGGKPSQRGPWTDLHALAAVCWFAVMGTPPPAARPIDLRLAFDAAFGAPASDALAQQRDHLCAVLGRALAAKPEDRPQSAAEMLAMLGPQSADEPEPAKAPELPPEPDPRVRAAIAAAVASIPDLESSTADQTDRNAGGFRPAREPASSTGGEVRAAKPAVPLAGLAPPFDPVAAARRADPGLPAFGPVPPVATPSPPAFTQHAAQPQPPAAAHAPARQGPSSQAPREAQATQAAQAAAASAAPASLPVFDRVARPEVEPIFEARFAVPAAKVGRQEPAFGDVHAPPAQPPRSETSGPAARLDSTAQPWSPAGDPARWPGAAAAPAQAERQAPVAAEEPAWAAAARTPEAARHAQPRRHGAGWAWTTAVFVGIATGVGAWQWTESRQRAASEVAAVPEVAAPTARANRQDMPPATPPAQVTAAPDASTDSTRTEPTAAGRVAAPSVDAPPTAATKAPATPAADAAAPGPQTGDERVAAAGAAPPVAQEQVGDLAERSGATGPDRGSPARPAARAPAARRTAAPQALPSPRATCGDRTNFSLVYCMQQQCRRPAYSAHAQCREFRRTGEVS